MNKNDLITEVSTRLGITKTRAKETVETVFGIIQDEMVQGNTVKISGFGVFGTKVRAPRVARNPKTGEKVQVGEKRVPTMRFLASLREFIKG